MLLSEFIDGFEQTPEAFGKMIQDFMVLFKDEMGHLRRKEFEDKPTCESFIKKTRGVVQVIAEGKVYAARNGKLVKVSR